MDEADEQPLVTWTHVMYSLHALTLVTFVLGVGFCLVLLMLALGVAGIAWIPLGTLRCAEHRPGEISGAALSDALTCAAVRAVSLWLIYRLARGWLTLKNRRQLCASF